MKRQPTISIAHNGFTLSKCIPEKLGDTLNFTVDVENQTIIIDRKPGEHMALVNYPSAQPVIKSMPLVKWIKKELGERNYSKMPVEWDADGEKFIVKPNAIQKP